MTGMDRRGIQIKSRVRNNQLEEVFEVTHIDEHDSGYVYLNDPYESHRMWMVKKNRFFTDTTEDGKYLYEKVGE